MTKPHSLERFAFRFDPLYRMAALPFGIRPQSSWVRLAGDHLEARFGPWSVRTALENVAAATITGPYATAKTIGPPHLSFADRGLTLATNRERGACISFAEPVAGIDPFGRILHPGLTVTVEDPDALVAALSPAVASHDMTEERQEQAAEDELHTMTASQLRDLADEQGLRHVSSMRKADLVTLLEADLGDDLVDELGPDD